MLLKKKKKHSKFASTRTKKKRLSLFRFLTVWLLTQVIIYTVTCIFSRSNFFFVCSRYPGDVCFWFSSKQLGFKRKQKRSPFVQEVFFKLLFFQLRKYNVKNIFLRFVGKTKNVKKYLYLFSENKVNICKLDKNFPIPFNGCRRKHKRRL